MTLPEWRKPGLEKAEVAALKDNDGMQLLPKREAGGEIPQQLSSF